MRGTQAAPPTHTRTSERVTDIPTSAPFRGFYLAVGGQARKVGKSTLVVDILKAFPDRNWIAVKITPYTQSGCPLNGPSCKCASHEHSYAIHNETQYERDTDSSRFLTAGASRAFWVQTKENQLLAALPALTEQLSHSRAQSQSPGPVHAIIESDALVKFWRPSLFLMVLDPANPDFKSSARENLVRADAFVLRSPQGVPDQSIRRPAPNRPADAIELPVGKPTFIHPLGSALPHDLRHFLSGTIPF